MYVTTRYFHKLACDLSNVTTKVSTEEAEKSGVLNKTAQKIKVWSALRCDCTSLSSAWLQEKGYLS